MVWQFLYHSLISPRLGTQAPTAFASRRAYSERTMMGDFQLQARGAVRVGLSRGCNTLCVKIGGEPISWELGRKGSMSLHIGTNKTL